MCSSDFVVSQVRWLQKLAQVPGVEEVPSFSSEANAILEDTISSFSVADATTVKGIEVVTNHDVKAIEYFLKERLGAHNELAKVLLNLFSSFALYFITMCTSQTITLLKTCGILIPVLESFNLRHV